MELRLNPTAPGRRQKSILFHKERPLLEADLQAHMQTEGQTKPIQLNKLRERHHALAHCLARGMTNNEAALRTGYHHTRVSLLKNDPLFKELIKLYHDKVEDLEQNLDRRLYELATDAVTVMLDRLEEEPEKFSTPVLLEVATKIGDRAGYGPTSTQRT